jgi:hypothetical protein
MIKHSHSLKGKQTKTYRAWVDMKQRCLNKKNKNYFNYGGRGIKICERWINSFENFFADMGLSPIGLTLERKNNNLGYNKENCSWESMKIQSRNRRLTPNVTGFTGVSKTKFNKFSTKIKFNNKHHYIGTFDTPKLASLAFQSCLNTLRCT